MVIAVSTKQIADAQGKIREWFPGKTNAGLRSVLRRQLTDQVREMTGQEADPMFPPVVKLGYGVLFINGAGDERTQCFNADVNQSLGL